VWQTGTILAGLVWGGLLLWLVWRLPERSIAVAMTSLTFPVYYASISIYLDRRRVTSF
jgi:hypothetical protein